MPGDDHTGAPTSYYLRRGLCPRHYSAWYAAGRPETFCGVSVPESLSAPASNLPNPWAKVAPACPRCRESALVFLWANDGVPSWFCQPCRFRFNEAEAKRRKAAA